MPRTLLASSPIAVSVMMLSFNSVVPVAASLVTPVNCAGAAGIGLGASWALFSRRSTVLACQATGAFAFALHFFLLGSLAGALMCLAGGAQSVAARLRLPRAVLLSFYAATLTLSAAIAFAASHGAATPCAVLGLACATIARIQQNTQRMRLIFLACTAAWTAHNILIGSLLGNVSDALTALGLFVGLWVHGDRRKAGSEQRHGCLSRPAPVKNGEAFQRRTPAHFARLHHHRHAVSRAA